MMRISSTTSFILPFVVLFAASFSIVYYILEYHSTTAPIDKSDFYTRVVLISLPLTVTLFIVCRLEVLKAGLAYFKYILLALPFLLDMLLSLIVSKGYNFSALPLLSGILLLYSFNLFTHRYFAILTDQTIEYKNLLGQAGSIPLSSVTKLEQKRSMLSIFREFRALDISKKTGVSFLDENLDEYEINIYTRAFDNKRVFESIISNANKCNNFKIRMYTA